MVPTGLGYSSFNQELPEDILETITTAQRSRKKAQETGLEVDQMDWEQANRKKKRQIRLFRQQQWRRYTN